MEIMRLLLSVCASVCPSVYTSLGGDMHYNERLLVELFNEMNLHCVAPVSLCCWVEASVYCTCPIHGGMARLS